MTVVRVFSQRSSTTTFADLVQRSAADTADGFTISQLEQNPSAFFADTHTVEYVAGAVRDQLA